MSSGFPESYMPFWQTRSKSNTSSCDVVEFLSSLDPSFRTFETDTMCDDEANHTDILCRIYLRQTRVNPELEPGNCSMKSLDLVPKIVFFVTFGDYKFEMWNYIAVVAAQRLVQPTALYVIGDQHPKGPWWEMIIRDVPGLRFIYRETPPKIAGRTVKHQRHLSDLVRLQVLYLNGGIYLDTDMVVLKSLDPLLALIKGESRFLVEVFCVIEDNTMFEKCSVVLIFATILNLIICTAIVLTVIFNSHGQTDPMGYRSAAVAADTQICSSIGKEVLLKGGNAVDAAIASLLCTGLVNPQAMGIGGGFFMTIYNRSNGQATVIDARETAPGLTSDTMYKSRKDSKNGRLSIAVPSEVQGYWYAHQRYGKLPWKDIFEPSIRMAEDGFPVLRILRRALVGLREDVLQDKGLKEIFWNNSTNDLYKEGEIMKRPKLAKILKVIALEGAQAFYDGSLTGIILQDLKDIGSIITREDLQNYTVLEKSPVTIRLNNGMTVLTTPSPSSGPVLALALNVLDGRLYNITGDNVEYIGRLYNITSDNDEYIALFVTCVSTGYNFTPTALSTPEGRKRTYHRIVETLKFVYAKRSGLGDDMYMDLRDLVHNLTSREYASVIRGRINDSRTYGFRYYEPIYASNHASGTTHLSVLDEDDNAVSATSTINTRFGSLRAGVRSGIIFNNEIDDFSFLNISNEWQLSPSPVNFIAPGKRPSSSMCPVVILDSKDSVSKVLGGAGGSLITSAITW
ncbi:Gamma-glutamyltranspeptidase 1, partial [Bulinus truncatus]